ncbi:MAG TPA: hypothetical protein VH867_04460 [Burkholderiales bacterium]|jgi:hypothetical protein
MPQSHILGPALPRFPELTDREVGVARGDSRPAEDSLLSLLGEIEKAPPRPAAYLHTLERLRKPVLHAQENLAKRFADAPIPLGEVENAALIQARDLWVAVARAYRRLLGEAISGKHVELKGSVALLCQRALACTGELMVAQYLARREMEGGYWRALHEAYAVAESHGVTGSTVDDVRHDATPASAYAEMLLMHLADPFGLSAQEFARVRRWAGHWADKARLVRDAPSQGGHAVDMSGSCGPAWANAGTSTRTVRFLDLTEVSSSIKKRLRRLEEGADPGELGLGHDCTPRVAENLLRTLGRAWLEPPAARAFSRAGATSPTLLASGFSSIHRALSENPLGAEAAKASYSYGEADRLHTLQRAYEAGVNWDSRVPGLENWERFEESPKEFRLRRKEPGASLAFRQLVALRPRGARQFILCEVRSLSEDADHTLTISARPLPGISKTCTVKAVEPGTQQPAQALMLPAGQGLPSAFLLPAGWFRRGREIEVRVGGQVTRVRLSALLDHGFDYERVQSGSP